MGDAFLVTGFPGFIGGRLVQRLQAILAQHLIDGDRTFEDRPGLGLYSAPHLTPGRASTAPSFPLNRPCRRHGTSP